MARKVIIDCDPGIDDAVAITMALFDPRLEVLAVTGVAGNVPAAQVNRNVQAIVEHLDPARRPRIGAASTPASGKTKEACHIHGDDGLGNAGFAVSELQHQHPSDKLVADIVRDAPEEVTIIALGPLTNVALAMGREPDLASMIGQIVMMGGSVKGVGNVTPTAEFNMHFDSGAAHEVFQSPTTKTLIPLDITRQLALSLDFLDDLPTEFTRAGAFLRRVVPFAYRAYRQQLGFESIYLHDAVALLATLHPEAFETQEMAGDVETTGLLTCGTTVFDRRPRPQWRPNMEVAVNVDVAAVHDGLLRCLRNAGEQS